MPIGNGATGANVWTTPDGSLWFYISRTDSWEDNSRLAKLGRIRVAFSPNPFTSDAKFEQRLDLEHGEITITSGNFKIRLWIDAHNQAVYVETDSKTPVEAKVSLELWRKQQETVGNECSDIYTSDPKGRGITVEPDTIMEELTNKIGWYHHNTRSLGPELTMSIQGLDGYPFKDPVLHRTFGGIVSVADGKREAADRISAAASTHHSMSVHVASTPDSTPATWLAGLQAQISTTESTSLENRRTAHRKWWKEFWQRSYIEISSGRPSALPAPFPENRHPLLIGRDQSGQNVFQGTIGRLTVIGRELTAGGISGLATLPRNQKVDGEAICLLRPAAGDIAGNPPAKLNEAMTVECWIQPSGVGNGRIVDKITPGSSDGFLMDINGGRLRMIAGDRVIQAPAGLRPGEWQHVACTVTAAKLSLYVDGKKTSDIAVAAGSADDPAFTVARGYALQRFITACSGRGEYPIKFNGSIFTVQEDYRRWGPGYWWQNTRLPYLSMCASGDLDNLDSLFRMYTEEIYPLCKYRTKAYFGFEGAYFPECMYPWGACFSETYGWTPASNRVDKLQSSGWHKWEWVAGPELACMMFDYYDFTGNEVFLRQKLLPLANDVLRFFNNYYKRNAAGKLVMHPAQACETWWNCTNPMPELAGIMSLSERLLRLPEGSTLTADRKFWTELHDSLPELPTRITPTGKALAPAESFANKSNCENPELYAVFPFRLIGVGRERIELGINALAHRWDRGHFGWRQDDIFMTHLGMAEEARNGVIARASNHDQSKRFPAFWGPNYDWTPDQDHGGVLMKTVQSMLLQSDPYSERLFLLPAWPKDWNVRFKLHAPRQTMVECEYRDGAIMSLRVTPASRQKDVVVSDMGKK